jgi:hypothetical protein
MAPQLSKSGTDFPTLLLLLLLLEVARGCANSTIRGQMCPESMNFKTPVTSTFGCVVCHLHL